MKNLHEFLGKFGLSRSEASLYLAMLSHGALLASDLVKITGGKRPTVYYAVRQLLNRGLVHKVATHGAQRFQAEPPEKLLTMLQLKRDELETQIAEVASVLPELERGKVTHEGLPQVSFYEGESAMKQIVMETLYAKLRHIDSLAPKDNFFWQVGQTFSKKYIAERVARKITTRNLWEQPLKPDIMVQSYKGMSKVRILPESMHGRYRTTMFLFDDKVMYISSLKSGYVLLVQSKEHHELMSAMYNGLWQVSKEVS